MFSKLSPSSKAEGGKSPDSRSEDMFAGQANLGTGNLEDNLGYACISSEGGTINILRISNLNADTL
jgi:hypothetical protein